MPDPLVTTNPADYLKLEGVYISPSDPPPFVKEVGTNKVGIFGTCLRGPTDRSVTVRSPTEFGNIYGSDRHDAGGPTIQSEIFKALLNKRFSELEIYRVAAAAAVKASFTLEDTAGGGGATVVRIDASSVGVWGNDAAWKVEAATGGDANLWNLIIRYKGGTVTYENIDTGAGTPGNDNTAAVIGTAVERFIDLAKLADGRPFNSIASADGADADGFTQLGATVAGFVSVAGSDGTVAASDYIATDGPLDTLATFKGLGVVFCANEDGATSATVNAQILVKAAASPDRYFPIHEGELTGASVTPSAVIADVASFRSDRISYCHNAPYTIDPFLGAEVQTSPVSWMASVLANTDVDIHPGEVDTQKFLAGITRLDQEITRENLVALKAAGVASIERDEDGGFNFVSGVTTSLASGKTEITRRRMADFIQLSAAKFAKPFVKKKGTSANRNQLLGGLDGWLFGLQQQERVVLEYSVGREDVNDPLTEAQGLEFIELDVRLINHMLHIVLLTDISTGTVIEQS